MLKHRSLIILLSVSFCFLLPLMLCSSEKRQKNDKVKFSKRFQQKWGKCPIKVRQQILSNNITGTFPSSKTVEKSAERFYTSLDYLPASLIRKSGLKYVTFLRNLELNNKTAGGIASGDTIYLPVNFNTKSLFHEFFHIFDPHRQDANWRKLNNKKFKYTGSQFYTVDMTKKEKRQAKKINRKDDIEDSFVSSYAMSFEHEDRAETFAYMIVEGKNFLKRTKNPVIKAKMLYIMNLFIKKNLLSKEFWEKHFDSKFKLKNRFYSNGSNKNTSGTGRR